MSGVNLAVQMTFTSLQPATDDEFEAFLDEVVEQLTKIGRENVILAAKLGDRFADFAVAVESGDFEIAAGNFLVDLRTALHAAGCSTAGWPRFTPRQRIVRELQDA